MVVNGALPGGLLAVVDGRQLELNAAMSWTRVTNAVLERYGWRPTMSPGLSGYRTYAQQETLFRQRYTTLYSAGNKNLAQAKTWNNQTWWLLPGRAPAARPGTSNHGLGIAVDVGYLGGFNGTRYKQFMTVAAEHGWNNSEGRSIAEAWHQVYVHANDRHTAGTPNVPTPDPIDPPIPEEDMPLNDADEDRIRTIVHEALVAIMRTADPAFFPLVLKAITDAQKTLAVAVSEVPARTLSAEVDPGGTGSLAQTTRDARVISRRTEVALQDAGVIEKTT